ncbi:glycosyltransferase [Herbaspirillum sp. BH-1]|uniref:UDP:flavonoid glycosyltransferase YjiC (YdhE family) n=1 Tax=Herbaspirillum frisingense TaxID=92645 RepID=A0ABU1PH40_9BURK|nr:MULTISPECIES: glycosyltransferase [Herbaspirillum]MDR6585266.1 UDP:flavonoid glycosyltransferase YjiC (YdhE family) [Herbaspirillum frisingense]PLY59028.1 glycosyltransferase [Herbaspirillum sp. BH-1]
MTQAAHGPLLILATTGTTGDMLPYLTLGRGLQARGHRVLMVVPRFHERIFAEAGLDYLGLGSHEEFQAVLGNPDLWDERKGWRVICESAAPHLDCLHQLIARLPAADPCVVLSHPLLVPAAAMARALRPDLRIVVTYMAPSNLCSSHDMLALGSLRLPAWVPLSWRQWAWSLVHPWLVDPAALPSLNAARARVGLGPIPHFFEHVLHAPDASLGLFPPWFGAVQPDWPQPFLAGHFPPAPLPSLTPQTLPPELLHFLDAGAAPIVFTPGSGHQHAQQFFKSALAAARALGKRALLVTAHPGHLPLPLPDDVMWQPYVAFDALLPRVAAIVHHGGIGTTAAAMRAGIPQLVVPFAYDQFDNGYRVQRMGVGTVLKARRLSARHMQHALAKLLESGEVARASGAIARTMHATQEQEELLDLAEQALLGPLKARPLQA